jgi:hypothetical protein
MRTLTEKLVEMKYASPFGTEKDKIKNLLIAASGNDQRVLNDLVDCLSEEQLVKCFDKLSKVYGYTGSYGQVVSPKIK